MDYNENEFKAKANIKARRIWLVFALLLSANYGTDVSQGGYPSTNFIIFLILCWVPFFSGIPAYYPYNMNMESNLENRRKFII